MKWLRSFLNGRYERAYRKALQRPDVRGVLNACSAMPGTRYWRGQERLWLDDVRASAAGVRVATKFGWIERKPEPVLRRTDWFVRLTPSGRNAYEDILKVDEAEFEKAMKARKNFGEAPRDVKADEVSNAA